MFATLVVVLPSLHEGGSVHVRLGQQEKIYETAKHEIGSTTVMAWYTGAHGIFVVHPIADWPARRRLS